MRKRPTTVTLFFSIMIIFTILSYNIVTIIIIPNASASPNATIQESDTSDPQNGSILTELISTPSQEVTSASQQNQSLVNATATAAAILESFENTVTNLIIGISILIVAPLLASMIIPFILSYRQSDSRNKLQFTQRDLFRLLVAIGVTFTVILIIVYLNTLVITLIAVGGPAVSSIIEIEENFLTIIGTAFASLIAFYFGTRGTQSRNAGTRGTQTSNGESTAAAATGPGTAPQKALEIIDIYPTGGTEGVEVDSPVTATFNTPIRTSTIILNNTFSVKNNQTDEYHKGNIKFTDNNKTLRFTPKTPFDQNTPYTVTFKKGIMDISGTSLAEDVERHFTTAA